MAPAVEAEAALVVVEAALVAVAVVLLVGLPAVLPVLLLELAAELAHPAHKLLPLVLLQVVAVRPVALPPGSELAVALPPGREVAALLLVQGLVASESLDSR